MKRCQYCAKELQDDAAFCGSCGKALSPQSLEPHFVVSIDGREYPADHATLIAWIGEGRVRRNTYVRRGNGTQWVVASAMSELAGQFPKWKVSVVWVFLAFFLWISLAAGLPRLMAVLSVIGLGLGIAFMIRGRRFGGRPLATAIVAVIALLIAGARWSEIAAAAEAEKEAAKAREDAAAGRLR